MSERGNDRDAATGDRPEAGGSPRTTAGRSRRCAGSRSCSSAPGRTPTRSRPSAAPRRRSCRWRADELRGRASRTAPLTDLPGVGASTAEVIEAAVRGERARPARPAGGGHAGPLAAGGAELRARAARRPALPLRLVRRRLADRGDGLHRDRARPRVPRAHRPLAAAQGRPRTAAPSGWPGSSTSSTRSTTHLAGSRVHAAQGHRGRHPRRRRPRPDRGDARPGSTSGSPACTPSSRWTRTR